MSLAQSLSSVSGATFNGSSIQWDALMGASGYNIYHAPAGEAYSYHGTVRGNTSYEPESDGNYYVVGFDDDGNFSPFQIDGENIGSSAVSVQFTDTVNNTPTNQLSIVTGANYDGSKITWNKLEGAIGYNVYYAAPGVGWVYSETIGDSRSYSPSQAGKYIIVGYDGAGNYSPFQIDGGANDTNDVAVKSGDIVEGALDKVAGATFDGVNITWDVLSGATGYNVYRFKANGDAAYITTINEGTSYLPEQPGRYYILGFDDAGNRSRSQIVGGDYVGNITEVDFSITPTVQLDIVTGVAYNGGTLTWDALSGATGYNVHYFYEGSGWAYLETVGNVTSYTPSMAGEYVVVGYNNAGSYSPFQVYGSEGVNQATVQ